MVFDTNNRVVTNAAKGKNPTMCEIHCSSLLQAFVRIDEATGPVGIYALPGERSEGFRPLPCPHLFAASKPDTNLCNYLVDPEKPPQSV